MASKYRREIFNEGLLEYIILKLKEVHKHYPSIMIDEINHDKDHVHILISIPPTMSVGSVVRIMKTNTAKGIKKKFDYLKKVYWGKDGIWSDGYFVSTTGINEKIIAQYIKKQGEEDSAQTVSLFETG